MINLFHSADPLCRRENVEDAYQAKFVLQSQYVGSSKNLSSSPADIFYVKNPDTSKGHTNYFGIVPDYDSGEHVFILKVLPELIVSGILLDGVFAYSSSRHDCVTHPREPRAFIDGGRNYSRLNPNFPDNARVSLQAEGPVMYVHSTTERGWWHPAEVNWGAAHSAI